MTSRLKLHLIFFLSGASALMFETLWFRLAGLTFGNSVWASSLVLASFMAGLAIGNLIAAVHGPRLERPLRTYASLEVAIGVAGALLVLSFPFLTTLMRPLFAPFLDVAWILNPLRLGIAFLLLLVPSTAMGATLPLLVKTMSVRDSNFGRVLGRLYGWNTMGAVVGAVVAEVVLIDVLGIRGTCLAAGSLNLLSAAGALTLSSTFDPGETPSKTARPRPSWRALSGASRYLMVAGFAAGACLLALEVVWFRFLLLFVEGTSLTFAIMLSVVLLGIGAGGMAASRWLSARPDAHRNVSTLFVLLGTSTALTYMVFENGSGVYATAERFPLSDPFAVIALTFKLVFPASFLSGVIFTLIGRSLERELREETEATALLTLSNTLGALLGPLLAGFFMIPTLGMETSFFSIAAGYGIAAFIAYRADAGLLDAPAWTRRCRWLVASAYVLLLTMFPFGLMKNHYFPLVLRPFTDRGATVVGVAEGVTETAFYLRRDLLSAPLHYRLATNGFSMSTTDFISQRYMRLFAYFPMALQESPRRALLISYGLGVTANALTDSKSFRSIDVVDISPGILELNKTVPIFEGSHPLDDPRVRVHIEDGRFFLQTTEERYDVITGEPPPPKYSGVVNLYSLEYFRLVYDRLRDGGIATYWLPVYQLEVREAKAIVAGFCASFANCSLWTAAGEEWMLMGTRGETRRVPHATFLRPWSDPETGEALRRIGVEVPEQLGATFLGGPAFLEEWVAGVPPVVDNFPHRLSPRHRRDDSREYAEVMRAASARERFRQSELIRGLWPEKVRARSLEYFETQELLNRYFAGLVHEYPAIRHALTETSLTSLPLILMGSHGAMTSVIEEAESDGIEDPLLDYLRFAEALSERHYEQAAHYIDQAVESDSQNPVLLGYRALASELTEEAVARPGRRTGEVRVGSDSSPAPVRELEHGTGDETEDEKDSDDGSSPE